MNWWKELKGKIRLAEPLNNHTTFRIGGPAKFFIEPQDIDDLKLLLSLVKRYKIPPLLIGAGSNILISDKGVDGIVLRLNSPFFKSLSFNNNYLKVGAGCLLNQMVRLAAKRSLSGVEFLQGIPGTVGGALVMNAGAWDKNIGRLVQRVTVMDYNGNIKTLTKRYIKFGYRKSNLSRYIILSVCLKLIKKDKKAIKRQMDRYLDERLIKQDLSRPSLGCVFKNPAGFLAGRLIDLCGLKGERIGGARISRIHGNFILNESNARAKDVLKLMDLVKKKVKKKFNVSLEPEIKIWQ